MYSGMDGVCALGIRPATQRRAQRTIATLFNRKLSFQASAGVWSNPDMERSWFGNQLRPLVVKCEIAGCDRKAHHNLLSRFQMDTPEALEFPHRPAYGRSILVDVELDDFICFAASASGHFIGGSQTTPLAQLRIGQAQ